MEVWILKTVIPVGFALVALAIAAESVPLAVLGAGCLMLGSWLCNRPEGQRWLTASTK